MTEQPTPIRDAANLAGLALDLQDKITQLADQLKTIKSQLGEQLGVGDHTPGGIPVKVQSPNRSFNADRAWTMLNPAQQALCMAPSATLVKKQLSAVLVEACMDAGTGANIIKVG